MIKDGLIDEVKKLKERGDLTLDMPSMRCVGYRQVWEYLDGQYDLDTMVDLCVNATSHLAKHQMTWLRGSLSLDTKYSFKKRLIIGDRENLNIVMEQLQKLL